MQQVTYYLSRLPEKHGFAKSVVDHKNMLSDFIYIGSLVALSALALGFVIYLYYHLEN